MYVVVPKGFFPVQDTGVILGVSEAPETTSFTGMADRQQALARVILQDPDVVSLSSFIGVDGTNMTPNSGRIQINLKPREERAADVTEIIRRLSEKLAGVEGITLYMQAVQDLTRGRSREPHAISIQPGSGRPQGPGDVGSAAGGQDASDAAVARCGHRPAKPRTGRGFDRGPRYGVAPGPNDVGASTTRSTTPSGSGWCPRFSRS